MPSTLVHVAFGGLLGAGLLGAAIDRRAVLVVLAVPAIADLDAFATFVPGGHRSVGHTLVLPLAAAALLVLDTRARARLRRLDDRSMVRRRWGEWGVRVAWVAVAVYALAGIGLDLVMSGRYGGVNLLYPFHDQFYRFDGRAFYSTTRGLVQTFVEVGVDGGGGVDVGQRGTSEQVRIASPVDPSAGEAPETTERIFPIVGAGWQLLVVVASAFVLATRLWRDEGPAAETTGRDPRAEPAARD